MKRTVSVLVLAAAWTSPIMAQETTTELYGNFRYSYGRADAGDGARWASANNGSRLGVRAEIAGDRLTAFADLQTGVRIDGEANGGAFTQRHYFAGVAGPFGRLTVGRHSTAYKRAGVRLDPFYDTSTISAVGGVADSGLFTGASFGLSNLTNAWADRAVAYETPTVNGFTANAAAYVDTDSDHDYGLGLVYRWDGLEAGLQYHDVGGGRTWPLTSGLDGAVRGHASFKRPGWSLGASYERLNPSGGDGQDFLYLAGTVQPVSRLMLAAAVGHAGDGSAQTVTGTGYHIGLFYALFPQARLHALYSRLDGDTGPARTTAALGLTYQFVLGGL